jgi:hypothetical protein
MAPVSRFLAALLLAAPSLYAQAPAPGNQGITAPPSSREVSDEPVLTGPLDQPAVELKRSKATCSAPVFTRDAKGGSGPCQLVRITATATQGATGVPAPLAYERFLGPLTMKSLGQVMQATSALHKGWPRGQKILLTFSEHPSPVELEAATVGGAFLLDSMLHDYDIDPGFAAVGSIKPDGSLEPVGTIADRIYAAGRGRVTRLVVPEKNSTQVADALLSQGVAAFVGTQIFTAKSLAEARPLAATTLDAETKEMVDLFGAVQRTLLGSGANAVSLLRQENVQGTLKKVLEKAPHHLTAKVLYDWGTGQRTTMSLDGSIDYIDRGAADLIRAMRAQPRETLNVQKAAVADNIARLRYVRDRLDTQARPYGEALLKLGEAIQKNIGSSSRPPSRLSASAQKELDAAREAASSEWTTMAKARINAPAPAPAP